MISRESGICVTAALLFLSDQWDLQIGRSVFFRVKATTIDISCTPKQHIIVYINQIVFCEGLSFCKSEGCKGFPHDTLRTIQFPFIEALAGNLVHDIRKALG